MDVPSKCCRELQKTRPNVISCGPPDTLFRWTRGESDAASEWSSGPWLTLEAAAKKKTYQSNPRGNCRAKCSMLFCAVLPKHWWAQPWENQLWRRRSHLDTPILTFEVMRELARTK